jgi:hypothetical protein
MECGPSNWRGKSTGSAFRLVKTYLGHESYGSELPFSFVGDSLEDRLVNGDSRVKKHSRGKIPDDQLQQLVRRLLRSNKPKNATPVIITGPLAGKRVLSVGRLLDCNGAWVAALVDLPLEPQSAVTVFLPANAYLAEVVSCTGERKRFRVELQLISIEAGSSR